MGRAEKEHLNKLLSEHLSIIHETFQVLDQTPSSSLDRVSWNQVIQLGEQVSKQATMDGNGEDYSIKLVSYEINRTVNNDNPLHLTYGVSMLTELNITGMLWTGETPEIKALEENMAAYFNLLQGFLLLSHGSTIGAAATLLSAIHASVKQVVDCSFMLMKEAVSSYGSNKKSPKLSIPQLAGTVWEACAALKKTPSTNVTAIGRAMTQVAVSIKDVLREMKDLKPASSDPLDEASDEVPMNADESGPQDSDNDSSEGELGSDLSPEEMKIAALTTTVVSETLAVIKELIRSITGLLKLENSEQNSNWVGSLERLLKLCQEIALQIDELGACLYPPQEVAVIKALSEKISSIVGEMQEELETIKGSSETFLNVCAGLRSSVKQLESELESDTPDLVPKMENLVISG